jgi:hypothetical protein
MRTGKAIKTINLAVVFIGGDDKARTIIAAITNRRCHRPSRFAKRNSCGWLITKRCIGRSDNAIRLSSGKRRGKAVTNQSFE